MVQCKNLKITKKNSWQLKEYINHILYCVSIKWCPSKPLIRGGRKTTFDLYWFGRNNKTCSRICFLYCNLRWYTEKKQQKSAITIKIDISTAIQGRSLQQLDIILTYLIHMPRVYGMWGKLLKSMKRFYIDRGDMAG